MRPRRLIDLDKIPVCRWPVDDEDAVFLWKDKLWRKERIGCVICTEHEGPEYATLCRSEDDKLDVFHCMQHGELVEIPFSMTKDFKIQIDLVERVGQEVLRDTMLFPAEMTRVARNELIESLLDDAERQEHEDGPSPTD